MSVEWTPQARASLQTIVEFVAQDDPDAAYRLADGIVDRTEAILTNNPNAGRPGRVSGTRELVAHKNYIIAYRVKKDQTVQALNVIHAARLWPQNF